MTETTLEDFSETIEPKESKKPQKEVLVVQDQGYFQHQTGDAYEGFFEVKKKDRSIKMNGPGVYRTAEGDTYTGIWEGDKFGSEEVCIAYQDGASFVGNIKDWSYIGRGKYIYPDASVLSCDFTENCPVGQLVLKDPNEHTWLGTAEQGFGWLEPVNHYYEFLATHDVVCLKKRNKKKANLEKQNLNDQDLKQRAKKNTEATTPIKSSPSKSSPSKTSPTKTSLAGTKAKK